MSMKQRFMSGFTALVMVASAIFLSACDLGLEVTTGTAAVTIPYLASVDATQAPIPRSWIPVSCSPFGPFRWPDRIRWATYGPAYIQPLVCGRTGTTTDQWGTWGKFKLALLYWNTADAFHQVIFAHDRPCVQTIYGQDFERDKWYVFHHLGSKDPQNPYHGGDLTAGFLELQLIVQSENYADRTEVDAPMFLQTCAHGVPQASSFAEDPVDPFARGAKILDTPPPIARGLLRGCTVMGVAINDNDQAIPWRLGFDYYSWADRSMYIQVVECWGEYRFLYVHGKYGEMSAVLIPTCWHGDPNYPRYRYYTAAVGIHDPAFHDQRNGSLTATAQQVEGSSPLEVHFQTQAVSNDCSLDS